MSLDAALKLAQWLPQDDNSPPRSVNAEQHLPVFNHRPALECTSAWFMHRQYLLHIDEKYTPRRRLRARRLVHRLDRDTSGALVVARTADAAAWLSQAFRQHALDADAGQTPHSKQRPASQPAAKKTPTRASSIAGQQPAVQRVYWAMVDMSGAEAPLPESGRVDSPVLAGNGGEQWQAAATRYSVFARSEEFAWLELQPETGAVHRHW